MTASFEGFRVEVEPPVARLSFARPPLHILDVATISGMHRALDLLDARGDVSVLAIGAEGERAFSAGVEVRDHLPDRLEEMLDSFHGFCRKLLALEAVTVAEVKGVALGGGMELLACCDFVLSSDDAVFGQPEIDLACFPPLGAALYPALFGPKRAAQIVLAGERLSAAEARSLGLVYRVVPAGDLAKSVEDLVGRLAQKSPAALRIAKKALRIATERALRTLPEVEALYREELAATEDMLEGLEAFLEKRKPTWKGK